MNEDFLIEDPSKVRSGEAVYHYGKARVVVFSEEFTDERDEILVECYASAPEDEIDFGEKYRITRDADLFPIDAAVFFDSSVIQIFILNILAETRRDVNDIKNILAQIGRSM